MSKERETFAKYPVLCLTCGNVSEKLLRQDKQGVWTDIDKCRCPKCSKTAYVLNPLRSKFLLEGIVKELVKVKGQVFELECMLEECSEER